jgi:hypothetical protein
MDHGHRGPEEEFSDEVPVGDALFRQLAVLSAENAFETHLHRVERQRLEAELFLQQVSRNSEGVSSQRTGTKREDRDARLEILQPLQIVDEEGNVGEEEV